MRHIRQAARWMLESLLAGSLILSCWLPAFAQRMETTGGDENSTDIPSAPRPAIGLNNNPFRGSVVTEKLQPGVLQLSLKQALDLGLKNNLGLLLNSYS